MKKDKINMYQQVDSVRGSVKAIISSLDIPHTVKKSASFLQTGEAGEGSAVRFSTISL